MGVAAAAGPLAAARTSRDTIRLSAPLPWTFYKEREETLTIGKKDCAKTTLKWHQKRQDK